MSTFFKKSGDNSVYNVSVSLWKTVVITGERMGVIKNLQKLGSSFNRFSTHSTKNDFISRAQVSSIISFSTYQHP